MIKLSAIKVVQPLAEFYIAKIKARDLLEIAFSEELQYSDENGTLKGSQRSIDETRLSQIAKYIESVEMSFPSSIIIAANYTKEGQITDDESIRWEINSLDNGIYQIVIPSKEKLAAVIDGQHRLYAFNYVSDEKDKDIELVVSIFFDLPNSYQAFLFATINGNQKKVDKGLALEQFGFNVQDEPEKSWTPEKLAVFLTRKLNFTIGSPLYHKIRLSPKYYKETLSNNLEGMFISTATFVDGILSLITSNPKRDRVEMGKFHIFKGRHRSLLEEINDKTPLRQKYLKLADDDILRVIREYFECVNDILWINVNPKSFIIKTVGVQALFDLLKQMITNNINVGKPEFEVALKQLTNIDFDDNFFQASGTGRSRIRKTIFYRLNLIDSEKLSEKELEDITRIISNEN